MKIRRQLSQPSSGPQFRVVWLRDACFRIRIILVVVLVRSQVCAKCVPGCLWSGSGVTLNYRVRKKLVKSGKSTQNASYWTPWTTNLLLYPPFPQELQWCEVGTFVFYASLLLGCSSQFFLFMAASFRYFLIIVIFYGKKLTASKTELSFYEGN